MQYSIHSPYPIQSILPLPYSHSEFATILPLTNLLQTYSPSSLSPLLSLPSSSSLHIDHYLPSTQQYLTHNYYTISLISQNFTYSLTTDQQIVTNMIELESGRFVNMSIDGVLHYYEVKDCVKEVGSNKIQGYGRGRGRGQQIPFVKIGEWEHKLGITRSWNECIIYNPQYQHIQKVISTPNRIQSLLTHRNTTLVNCQDNLLFFDTRVGKIIRKYKLGEGRVGCVRIVGDEVVWSQKGSRRLRYYDVGMGEEGKSVELGRWEEDGREISTFEFLGRENIVCAVQQPCSLQVWKIE